MDYYADTLVDKTGFYFIHKYYCERLPKDLRRLYLGNFESVCLAISVSETYFFSKVRECNYCCRVSKNSWQSTYMSLITKS